MLNAEKYKDKLLKFVEENHDSLFGLDKNSEPISCAVSRCNNCQFGFKKSKYVEGYSCSAAKIKWILSEYKEPVKLTRFEYFILDWLLNSQCVRYIARDRNGNLYAHINKPCRVKYEWRGNVSAVDLTIFGEFFAFVKWQNTEPTSIEDVLNNCEVVESDL